MITEEIPVSAQAEQNRFLGEIRRQVRLIDLLVITAVPIALLWLYALPRGVKLGLSLEYLHPTVVTAFTAHYVHLAPRHLAANLVGYAIIVPFVYLLAVLGDRRTHFYVAFVTFLFAFPFVISALNVIIERPRIGYGFSGIVMAFLGFLPPVLFDYVGRQFAEPVGNEHSPVMFFFGAGVIAVWAVPRTPVTEVAALAAAITSAVYLRRLLADLPTSAVEEIRRAARRSGYFEFALAGGYLFALFPFAAFPHTPVGDGTILNLYTHVLGFCFGFIVPFVTLRVAPLVTEWDRDGATAPTR